MSKRSTDAILDAIEWVDEPPPDARATAPKRYDWTFLLGMLSQRPGQWAKLDVPHTNLARTAHYLRENHPCEAITRAGVLYARWMDGGS